MLVEPQDPILATFVIDVLTGSSAGGINSVFLAKALANDQELAGLTDLWLDQGGHEEAAERPQTKVENLCQERPPTVVAEQSTDVRRPPGRLRPDGGEEPIRSLRTREPDRRSSTSSTCS